MRIVTTTGNRYDTVGIVRGDMDNTVYRVADITNGQFVGYVGSSWCGNILMYGPLANSPETANYLACQCARNRGIMQQKRIRELVRGL